ncbi:MAG: type II toxin-antitoxin system Phd/YefM family antitoxin [Candidatus Dadabacteria bacterium]|nr:type II toxin-antitoxin system Phd/YefM family antitoxin [Candidatus Dadabacteria bacterium]NIS09143.1 type II toxin-antitoxin system Phd/YefM family antitoxin [Candidatus Dadabacteria bacterium]NIY22450.1 type II toxin-antitoxin system Phd/YefM family antitoxin [Candidatus Dadabacteria bacterium]
MKATIVDLRYKMKEVIKALDRKETVTILYHGKEKGLIVPIRGKDKKDITKHPFFGMNKDDKKSVEKTMKELRESRVNDI